MTICPFDIEFSQDGVSVYHYKMLKRPLKMGDYYINDNLTPFFKIQKVLHHSQLQFNYPVIVETDNPNLKINGTE